MYFYISWRWTEKLYMEKYVDADVWQVQLAINVHKVRCTDCTKLLLRKQRANVDRAYGVYHCGT